MILLKSVKIPTFQGIVCVENIKNIKKIDVKFVRDDFDVLRALKAKIEYQETSGTSNIFINVHPSSIGAKILFYLVQQFRNRNKVRK